MAQAQSYTINVTDNSGNVAGQLSYSYSQQSTCDGGFADQWYGSSYTASDGTVYSANFGIVYLSSAGCGIVGGWNTNGNSNSVSTQVGSCTLTFSASINDPYGQAYISCPQPITVSGYINPKYVIIGVTYAPPGPQSYVDYTNSAFVSNTSSITNTFHSGYNFSINVDATAGILGFASGGITASSSTSITQSSSNSSSVTISKTTTQSDKTPGLANPYVGVNHDKDIIWLWLNPVDRFTLTLDSSGAATDIQWNGYGYSTLDPAGVEIYPVYVGWLNGDKAMTASDAAPLARTWAAGEIWPSGQGPGLTPADFQNIEQADPYWSCTPNPSSCPTSPDLTRFTQTNNNQNLVYEQPIVGGEPGTQTYLYQYTNSSNQGQGNGYVFSQTFGLEEVFHGSLFGNGLKTTMQQSATLQWTYQANTSITSTSGYSAKASVTGPPCNVVANVCDPVYFGQTEMDIYQDNVFGTFMFNPIN
jgi:hypothetical protein